MVGVGTAWLQELSGRSHCIHCQEAEMNADAELAFSFLFILGPLLSAAPALAAPTVP